jgi:hypothetical protein
VRTLLATVACVLLAGNSAHAQRSSYQGWAALQIEAMGRYPRRVTVRTAAGQATGTLRAVGPDRLVFGDRASKPTIVARNEICEVSTARHPVRPRTTVISIAIGGALVATGVVLGLKGSGTGARIVGSSGLGAVVGANRTFPSQLLYSNPQACSREAPPPAARRE